MFNYFLAELSAHAVANTPTEAAGGGLVHEMVSKFGIDGFNVAMQLFSFTLMAVVLYLFAIKPTLSTMQERAQKIEAGLKNAEASTARLTEAQNAAAAQLKEAQVAANQIIEQARRTAKELADREAATATERANAMITKAQQAIELEHKKMLEQARGEIARLVILTTERVLAKKLSEADRSAYNETAARELASV